MPTRPRSHQAQTSLQRTINESTGVGGTRVQSMRRQSTMNGRAADSVFARGGSSWDSGSQSWVWRPKG